jgi:hypothetical protein
VTPIPRAEFLAAEGDAVADGVFDLPLAAGAGDVVEVGVGLAWLDS